MRTLRNFFAHATAQTPVRALGSHKDSAQYQTSTTLALRFLAVAFMGGFWLTCSTPPQTTPLVCDGSNGYDLDGDASNGCEYVCTKTSDVDEPDALYQDSNCDGIDGMKEQAVFVDTNSGVDSNEGTLQTPIRTIHAGIDKAVQTGKPKVFVSEGTYFETVVLVEGVSLYGGYSRQNAWQRSVDHKVVVQSVPDATGSTAMRGVAISKETVVADMQLNATDATSSGTSAYGVNCLACEGLHLLRVVVEAGRGGKGENGADGFRGYDGLPGTRGQAGYFRVNGAYPCQSVDAPASGGLRGEAPQGGYAGGAGGEGGLERVHIDGWNGAFGMVNTPRGAGSPGVSIFANSTENGPPGGAGTQGRNGTPGVQGDGGRFANSPQGFGRWIPPFAQSGGDAEPGWGGGGGGGSGRVQSKRVFSSDYLAGNGGGGGGSGGSGGVGGTEGQSAGGSFGVFLTNSQGTVIEDSIIRSGTGGQGGNGGLGGHGGTGGVGAPGGGTDCTRVGPGGSGGNGGHGGWAGDGGGGAGGPSFAIYQYSSNAVLRGQTQLFPGVGGPGGSGHRASDGEFGPSMNVFSK